MFLIVDDSYLNWFFVFSCHPCVPDYRVGSNRAALGYRRQASQSRVLCCCWQANQAKVTFLPIIQSADNQNCNCFDVFVHNTDNQAQNVAVTELV